MISMTLKTLNFIKENMQYMQKAISLNIIFFIKKLICLRPKINVPI